jgi:hypothetical protein
MGGDVGGRMERGFLPIAREGKAGAEKAPCAKSKSAFAETALLQTEEALSYKAITECGAVHASPERC